MEQFSYKNALKNKQIKDIYNNVDRQEISPWSSHGLKHINAVLKYAKIICKMFKINEKTANLTFLACILHDIGAIGGKENHWKRSELFAQNYLKNAQFNKDDIMVICEAILNHHFATNESSMVHLILVLSDKLDITKARILPAGKKIIGMRQTQYINKIKLQKTANLFNICIKTTKKFNKTEFLEYSYTKKLIDSATIFATKMHRAFKLIFY